MIASGSAAPIVVVGSLNMDVVLTVERAPDPGETLFGRAFKLIPGGKGANQAVACARLGGRVAMIGCVGADEFGDKLQRGLLEDGVRLDHLSVDMQSGTGVALILVDDAGQNRIVIVPGANASLAPAHIDAAGESIDHAELLIVQLETPLATVAHAMARAARAGKRIVLNPAPAMQLPEEVLSCVDYLIPNETEATLLTGIEVNDPKSAAAAASELMSRGPRCVLVTLGAQGVLIADSSGTRHYAPPPVKAIDTTAAGDTYIGAFAVALLEGVSLDDAARFAMKAASISVTRAGAQTSIPRRADLV